MPHKINFGKKETTSVLDGHGSTKTENENIIKGESITPKRVRYEIKKRVHNKREEQEAYLLFSTDVVDDPKKLDPDFKIERSKVGNASGYYYAVSCYTVLEY